MSDLRATRTRLARKAKARAQRRAREEAEAGDALRGILASQPPGSPRWRNAHRGLRRRGLVTPEGQAPAPTA